MNKIQKNRKFFRSNFFLIKNRKGWIRIIEAFVAVLLISGVALIVLDKENSQGTTSNLAQDTELAILRGVQLDDNLRDEILATSGRVLWDGFSTSAPGTKEKVESETPANLKCVAQICEPTDPCFLDDDGQKDIFAESVIITTNLDTSEDFDPRVLKLFCWEK